MTTSSSTTYSIGVDIGGSFTDAIVVDDRGAVTIGKAPSTPPAFEGGFIDSLASAAERRGIALDELVARAEGIHHGCTVGTNALVEGRTAKVGLLTTRGMRDSTFTMQAGGRLWGLPPAEIAHVARHVKPAPLVPKHLIEEVDERIAFDGEVFTELNVERCRESIARLQAAGVEAFAVSLLWSVANPAHEHAVAALIRELAPDAFVSVGVNLIARRGEYERTIATIVNALIGPVMDAYLAKLQGRLESLGYTNPLYVMSCSGGVIDAGFARARPLLTIGSGPVAGLIGAGGLARIHASAGENGDGAHDVLTTDMGGTTFDVGVIRAGQPLSRSTTRHGLYEYFVPTLDVRSVGAGGGSIVRFDDETRTLRVGPTSAGADPGPVAYGRGGTRATVTDADLVLGFLNPDYFLGGGIALSADAARDALGRVGAPLGYGPDAAAAAACRIVDSQMADAMRLASVQQGYDPRDHDMYAYGGAGPVHATAIAADLGIRRIVVPLSDLASGWSAFGAVSADALVVEEQPRVLAYPFDPAQLNDLWKGLERRVREAMREQGITESSLRLERFVDMRYTAQVNTVPVQAPDGPMDESAVNGLVESFEREYARLFGESSGYPDAGYALTALRVRARGPRADLRLQPVQDTSSTADGDASVTAKGQRGVIFYEQGLERIPTPLYDGPKLRPGMAIGGPAIIEFIDTTVVLRAGDRAHVDRLGSIVINL